MTNRGRQIGLLTVTLGVLLGLAAAGQAAEVTVGTATMLGPNDEEGR